MPGRTPDKPALRQAARTARADLGAAARASASRAIRARLAALPEVAGARTVLAYAATGAEVDLDPLLTELLGRGTKLLLPYVDGEDLGAARVVDLAALAPGHRGVREPADPRPADLAAVDAALVPGVAFDPSGGRLGHGGGHFDRLLARLAPEATTIGVAFAAQVVDAVPREAHDVGVDVLVTEEATLRP